MKLYIIDSLNKYFYTEDDLLKFLALEKTRIYSNKSSSIKVKTVNFEIESEISGNDYLSSSIVKKLGMYHRSWSIKTFLDSKSCCIN